MTGQQVSTQDLHDRLQRVVAALIERPENAHEHLTQAGHPIELAEMCAEVLRSCAIRQFAPSGTGEERSGEDLAITAEQLVSEILATQPQSPSHSAALMDELTRERQAALAD